MRILTLFFQEIFYRPLWNGLIFLYNILPYPDFGFAIVILSVAVRLVLLPLTVRQMKLQEKMSLIQPDILAIQKRYQNDKERQTKALLELYRQHKVNPLGGLWPIIPQFLFIIALFRVFTRSFDQTQLSLLYPFVANPGELSPIFLGTINLSQKSFVLAAAAGISQFIQAKLALPHPHTKAEKLPSPPFQKQMLWLLPIFVVGIATTLPSALPLSWTVMNIFAIFQQEFIKRKLHKESGIYGAPNRNHKK